MARRRRGCLGVLFFIALLIVAALGIAPYVPLTWLKPKIEKNLSATLGRAVTVDSVRLTVFGGPFLTLNGVTIHEDPDFGDGNLLRAPEVRVNIGLGDIASQRRLVTDAMTIHAPEVAFVKNAGGGWSWATLGKGNSH